MGKYYCLIAGLPNIALDDSKLTYSISQFRQELDGILTKADKKLIDLFFLKFDNKNLIAHAKQPDRDPEAKKTNRKFPGKTVWQPSIMRMP